MATTPNNPGERHVQPSKHLGIIRFPSSALDNTAVRQALTMDIPVTDADVTRGYRIDPKTRAALVPLVDRPGLSMAVTTDATSGARFANTEAALAEQGFAFDLDSATPEAGDFHLHWRPTMDSHAAQAKTDSGGVPGQKSLEDYAQPRMAASQAPAEDSMAMN
jgi:hypothetical protein